MIFVDDLPYGQWRKWREQGLGGSDAPTIMGKSPWETARELWLRRTGRLEDRLQTHAMERGLRLEAEARELYQDVTGILMPKQLGIHDIHPWLRASYDGFNKEIWLPIEIKCPGKEDHALACRGKIPEKYLYQLVHLLLVSDLPVIEYVSYNERTLAVVPFHRDLKLEARLIKKEMQFWQCIVDDVPPAVELQRALPPKKGDNIFKVRKVRASR